MDFFHELTMKRNTDNDEVSGISGRVDGKTTTPAVWYDVPQCTPTVIQQHLLNDHTVTNTPTELTFFKEIPFFQKILKQQLEWIFELRVRSWIDVNNFF